MPRVRLRNGTQIFMILMIDYDLKPETFRDWPRSDCTGAHNLKSKISNLNSKNLYKS